MDINDLEKQLTQHEFDVNKVIAILLKNTARNTAYLETIFEMQANILSLQMPEKPFEEIGNEASSILNQKHGEALARLLSQLYTD